MVGVTLAAGVISIVGSTGGGVVAAGVGVCVGVDVRVGVDARVGVDVGVTVGVAGGGVGRDGPRLGTGDAGSGGVIRGAGVA